MVREEWFKRYDPETFDLKSCDRIVQSWDTANKPTELADYSVCTTWVEKDDRIYLWNVFRRKLGYPELKRAVIEQNQLFKPAIILIEDKASGTQLIQDLRYDECPNLQGIESEGDKIMRLHAQTAVIENGFVYLPTNAPWLADYLHELTLFPNGRHDDQVDSTSQALAWIRKRLPEYGFYLMVQNDLARWKAEREERERRFR